MNFSKKKIALAGLLILAAVIAGCATSSHHYSSSVVQYLYPDQTGAIQAPDIPVLSLPLKVGIAFVPGATARNRGYVPVYMSNASALTEKEKMSLMQEVGKHFKKYEYVKSVDLIPSAYLRPEGSFTNLDQIRTMYGVDVIALLSYDQTQFKDSGLTTISYWTIVGAYAVKGERNDTHTMVDAAVLDIKSRKMLFRAPGLSQIKSKATPVNLSEQNRLDSIAGFKEAGKELIVNLDEQLELFKDKIKESPEEYKIIHKDGYKGAGSLDISILLITLIAAGYFVRHSRKKKA